MQEKRIAIVTGAGKGIGQAIAMELGRAGIVPVIFDFDEQAARATVQALADAGVETTWQGVDVSKVDQLERAVGAVEQAYGRIDVLVNNAGVLSTAWPENLTEDEWDRVLDINLKGVIFATKFVLPAMLRNGYGRIINISSNAGRGGGIGSGVAYSASKAGVLGLTKSLARKYAQKNITVNAVAPGPTSSDIVKGYTPEEYQKISASIPVGRFGTPEEIAKAVAFLASESSGFITGATLDVNGGIYIG